MGSGFAGWVVEAFARIIEPFLHLGLKLAAAAIGLLLLTMAVKAILVITEFVLDDQQTMAGLINQFARGALVVGLITVAMGNWDKIQGYAFVFASEFTQIAVEAACAPTAGTCWFPPIERQEMGNSPAQQASAVSGMVLQPVMVSSLQLVENVVELGETFFILQQLEMTDNERIDTQQDLRQVVAEVRNGTRQIGLPGMGDDTRWGIPTMGSLVQGLLGLVTTMLFMVGFIVAAMGGLFLAAVVLLQVIGGLFMMLVGLAMAPFTIAAFPLIPTWSRECLSVVMTGMARFVIATFMGLLTAGAVAWMIEEVLSGRVPFTIGSHMTFLFTIALLCVVLGLCIPQVNQLAGRIFGSFFFGSKTPSASAAIGGAGKAGKAMGGAAASHGAAAAGAAKGLGSKLGAMFGGGGAKGGASGGAAAAASAGGAKVPQLASASAPRLPGPSGGSPRLSGPSGGPSALPSPSGAPSPAAGGGGAAASPASGAGASSGGVIEGQYRVMPKPSSPST